MKRHTKLLSFLISVLMLAMTLIPIPTLAAATDGDDENYVEIEVTFEPNDAGESVIALAALSPIIRNGGVFNAFFNKGQTTATTNTEIYDCRDSGIPEGAKVTKVEVASVRTAVTGMTYYVQIGRGSTATNLVWAPNILWASTVSTNNFNGQHPSAYWALRFYATRLIPNPSQDFGAGATVSSATLRIYWS